MAVTSSPSIKVGLPPIVGPNTRLLLLGSLPGEASLKAARYYAHPRNAFWALIGHAAGKNLVDLDYPARLVALQESGIGLWDVIARAERKGSLDHAIRNAEASDLRQLVANLPELRAVAFNGATAARIGRRSLGETPGLRLIDLPSSSPAHTQSYTEKLSAWSVLRTAFSG